VAEVSDLDKEENALEQEHAELVEVYAGLVDAAGAPILFEAYVSTDGLHQQAGSLFRSLLPLPLGAIAILALATLPLATSLARKVDRGQQQMRRLLLNAVASSDLERRRVARNLHDGVIQDLAGVGYALAAEMRHLPEGQERANLEQAHSIVARDLVALRMLMTDIYPPDLDQGGLPVALHSLVEHSDFGGATVTVQVQEDLTPTPLGARVAYRLIREVLRNALLHAHADHVYVRVGQHAGLLEFEVVDDGVGFDPELGSPEGHLGLRLVREMAADAGGRVTFRSAPGEGTSVTGEIPL
jgi:signal transduction histidine kinase